MGPFNPLGERQFPTQGLGQTCWKPCIRTTQPLTTIYLLSCFLCSATYASRIAGMSQDCIVVVPSSCSPSPRRQTGCAHYAVSRSLKTADYVL